MTESPTANMIIIPEPMSITDIPGSTKTSYPFPFAQEIISQKPRYKRKVGDYYQLHNFGINHTTLPPSSSISALLHAHDKQDEFIYVLSGTMTLLIEISYPPDLRTAGQAGGSNNPTTIRKEFLLQAGDCYGFPCRVSRSKTNDDDNTNHVIIAHQCLNHSNDTPVTYLEIGDRTLHDIVTYPHHDLIAHYHPIHDNTNHDNNTNITKNTWIFTHRDGKPYANDDNNDHRRIMEPTQPPPQQQDSHDVRRQPSSITPPPPPLPPQYQTDDPNYHIPEPISYTDLVGNDKTLLPHPFAHELLLPQPRVKRHMGDYYHLHNFGVNHTTLPPQSKSSLLHAHEKQDEFIYVLSGTVTLLMEITYPNPHRNDNGPIEHNVHHNDINHVNNSRDRTTIRKEFILQAGDCYGFPCRMNRRDDIMISHQCRNHSTDTIATMLEIGDRTKNDIFTYPHHDLITYYYPSSSSDDTETKNPIRFTHRDGTPY